MSCFAAFTSLLCSKFCQQNLYRPSDNCWLLGVQICKFAYTGIVSLLYIGTQICVMVNRINSSANSSRASANSVTVVNMTNCRSISDLGI